MSDSETDASVDYTWRAYEAAQKHYDADLTLFTNRMNLFLVVESALLAIATSALVRSPQGVDIQVQISVSIFGILLSVAWLAVAASSYCWVMIFRRHLIALGETWESKTGVVPSSTVFSKQRRGDVPRNAVPNLRFADAFAWLVRPTVVICCIPVVYIAGWISLLAI